MGLCFPGAHGLQGDFRRALWRKMEFAGGDAAERQTAQAVFFRQLQTGAVTGGQLPLVRFGQRAGYNRSDGVQHIAARQIKRRCYLCAADRFRLSLFLHDFSADQPQLHARIGVDGVVNTAVAGMEAAQKPAVGGVDNAVAV